MPDEPSVGEMKKLIRDIVMEYDRFAQSCVAGNIECDTSWDRLASLIGQARKISPPPLNGSDPGPAKP